MPGVGEKEVGRIPRAHRQGLTFRDGNGNGRTQRILVRVTPTPRKAVAGFPNWPASKSGRTVRGVLEMPAKDFFFDDVVVAGCTSGVPLGAVRFAAGGV